MALDLRDRIERDAHHDQKRGSTEVEGHAGRRNQVWQVQLEDEDGKAVCAARCTIAIVDLET